MMDSIEVKGGAGRGVEAERKLTLALPPCVIRQLRERTVAEDTTIRALILEALKASGYEIPADQIRDRRRPAS